MKYMVTINDKNYEIEVERGQATILKTTQATAPAPQAPVAPAAPTPAAVPTPAPTQAVAPSNVSGEAITAPMPGTILDVKVSSGATVKKGEILVILEAMKMENEIIAPRDGVISHINTSKGASVSTGDVLLALN